jgi:hypothetical protein
MKKSGTGASWGMDGWPAKSGRFYRYVRNALDGRWIQGFETGVERSLPQRVREEKKEKIDRWGAV